MMRWRVLLALLLLLLVLGQPALAGRGRHDRVVLGRNATLGQGQQVDGDLVVFGGDAILEAGSAVRGSVLALGGSIRSAGTIAGQAMAPSASVVLQDGAVVGGDVLAAGEVNRPARATVGGQVIAGYGHGISLSLVRRWPGRCPVGFPGFWFGWPWGVGLAGNALVWTLQVLLGSLVVVALGTLVALLLPRPVQTTAEALARHPWQSFIAGLSAAGAVMLALVPLLIVTCIGIPIAAAAVLALAAFGLVGGVAVGAVVGEHVLAVLGWPARRPLPRVGAGLALLSALTGVPYLGLPLATLVGLWGLGAAVLTRFGMASFSARPPRLTRPGR